MATVEQVYGKAAAMRLRTEKAVMEQFGVSAIVSLAVAHLEQPASSPCILIHAQRLPGLPSSHAGLDTLTGADEQIEFSDFLNGTRPLTMLLPLCLA